ncbi:MAG: hypothetical protein GY862_26555 [Gammaproteobacteria bacterium]|nr:hypothetical protein [Gammaproteobacteria bacterium]
MIEINWPDSFSTETGKNLIRFLLALAVAGVIALIFWVTIGDEQGLKPPVPEPSAVVQPEKKPLPPPMAWGKLAKRINILQDKSKKIIKALRGKSQSEPVVDNWPEPAGEKDGRLIWDQIGRQHIELKKTSIQAIDLLRKKLEIGYEAAMSRKPTDLRTFSAASVPPSMEIATATWHEVRNRLAALKQIREATAASLMNKTMRGKNRSDDRQTLFTWVDACRTLINLKDKRIKTLKTFTD